MQHRHGNTAYHLADKLYTLYCESVGGLAFNGDPLPKWTVFRSDASKLK